MSLGREAIWSALFGLLSPMQAGASSALTTLRPFRTVSRRARDVSQVTPGEQPALYVLQKREQPVVKEHYGTPTKWELEGWLLVYARNDVDAVAPGSGGGQVLNPLLDAIEAALAPVPAQGNVQTLGGLVSRVIFDGELLLDEGNIDNQAVAVIPIRIIGPV